MTSYITSNLLPNEKILYRTHRHWIVFFHVIVWVLLTFFVVYAMGFNSGFTWIISTFTLIAFFYAFIDYQLSELAVTNMRVLVKVGFIARSSLETNLQNIATISVDQSVLGRILGYGTLNIYDTGWMRSPFSFITDPFEFRRIVQTQIGDRFPPPPEKG